MTKTGVKTAGKLTRDRLYCKLTAITGRAVSEVRVTPALYGDGSVWCAMAIGCDLREIPLPSKSHEVAAVIRAAFPGANWARAQDYDVTTGALVEHIVRMPACLGGEDQ
ncbi:hypothetical protein ABZX77_05730 [Streptomyces sp. NPDC004237]|uniref:hypothetical protein n=1 Tax=Streptomyces sp. NPDC004237 TaxID=3154455 RepID=UPI0033B172E7